MRADTVTPAPANPAELPAIIASIDGARIESAAALLRELVHRTPVMRCASLDQLAGRSLYFKCENFQRTGSFKFRGASHAIRRLDAEQAAAGVVTHSSGNHAQAVALAARMRGIEATVIMPENASPPKIAAVRGYGAKIVFCAPRLEARDATCAQVQARTGASFIHPYDHPDVIAGQATATLELIRQCAEQGVELDAVIAPVGGGGLLSGACLAAHHVLPSARVFGAEPAGADDAARSLAAGQLIPQTDPQTVADGLLTSLGSLTWPILQQHITAIARVDDRDIIAAMRLIWERAKLLIETNAAVAVAALLGSELAAEPGLQSIGVILSGGNADLDRLPWQ